MVSVHDDAWGLSLLTDPGRNDANPERKGEIFRRKDPSLQTHSQSRSDPGPAQEGGFKPHGGGGPRFSLLDSFEHKSHVWLSDSQGNE